MDNLRLMRIPAIPMGFIRALPPTLGVPLMFFVASVSPDDVSSNISKWAHKVGISNPPQWLNNQSFDRQFIVAMSAVLIIYLYFAYVHPRVQGVAIAAVYFVLTVVGAWYFWPASLSPEVSQSGFDSPKNLIPTDAPSPTRAPADKQDWEHDRIVQQLYQEFLRSGEANCVDPLDQWYIQKWMNRRLEQRGEIWRVPVPTILVEKYHDNYKFGGCNSIDVKAKDAEVTGNHQYGSKNEINVDADKSKVHDNSQSRK
jgi:hypothetical protein